MAVRPREAMIELVRHSFAPRTVEAAGLQPSRLATFNALASLTPVVELQVPTGRDRLPAVLDAVVADVRARAPR
jgi:hypothetical protein